MSDHEWDQMSVMERCEVLRAQVRRLDETIAASFTVEPGWSVSEGELARLRRIEDAAARTLVHIDMNPATLDISPAVRDLRAALDSEPER